MWHTCWLWTAAVYQELENKPPHCFIDICAVTNFRPGAMSSKEASLVSRPIFLSQACFNLFPDRAKILF